MSFYLPIYIGAGPTHGTDPVPQAADKPNKPKSNAGKGRKEASPLSVFGILGLTSITTTATKDPQMASQASPENGSDPDSGAVSTAVAIDKDKNSSHAVKWAIDNLAMDNPHVTLIHVMRRTPYDHTVDGQETDVRGLFGLYRGYCARKEVQVNEVIIEENDVSKALLEYIANNYIKNMVVGASTRNALSRKLKNPDVSNILKKSTPDFCSVFVISKGKVSSVKLARRAVLNTGTPPRTPTSVASLTGCDPNDPLRGMSNPQRRSTGSELLISEKKSNDLRSPARDSTSDMSETSDLSSPLSFGSMDIASERLDFSVIENDSSGHSSISQSSRELEAEMKRLRLELKQTMDMYSNACKEAISAKKKAAELQQLKMEEARKFEEARLAEESALAIAEMEKAKCKAAVEAAEKAQKLAEVEARRRREAELKAKLEMEEKDKALSTLHQNDIRYQKYTIAEIQEATNNFARENKIGEGGYGPVYKGRLNHTRVAIKVLRPDATQGKRQFHQEVEILSCMRHPNMVLLLGACPEYGCLVYEYMDFGSLEDRLFKRGNTPPISWRRRFKIASEIATALLFLHQAKPEPLVHRDLKPANILLDRNYKSKISDVGLARLVPPSLVDSMTQYHMTCAAGTFCYIDPEYQQTGKLTTRSDIYSLGIMLLQIITARPPMGLSHQVQMAIEKGKFEEMLDPVVRECPVEETLAFAKLALQCSELRQRDRPDLGTVIVPELNRLRDFGRSYDHHRSNGHNTPKSQEPCSPTSSAMSHSSAYQVENRESSAASSPSPREAIADGGID